MKNIILLIIILYSGHQLKAEEFFDFFSTEYTRGFLFDSKNNPIIYSCGIKQTTDNGKTWIEILPCNVYTSDSTIFRLVDNVMFVNDSIILCNYYLQYDVINANSLLLKDSLYGSGILKTSNAGKNWYQVNSTSGCTFALDSNDTILAGADSCLLISTDYGDTWINNDNSLKELYPNFKIKRIVVSSLNAVYVYAIAGENDDYYILKSEDNCGTWDEIYFIENGGQWQERIFDLAVDYNNNIYILTSYSGIKISTDKGVNWDSFTSDFDDENISKTDCWALVFTKKNIPIAFLDRDIYSRINGRWKLLRMPLQIGHQKIGVDNGDCIFIKELIKYDFYKSKTAINENLKKLDLYFTDGQKFLYNYNKKVHRGDTVKLKLSLKGIFDEHIDDAKLSVSIGSSSETFSNVFDDKDTFEYEIVISDTCNKNISVVFQAFKDGYFDSEKAIAFIEIDTLTSMFEDYEKVNAEFNIQIAPNPAEDFIKIYCSSNNSAILKIRIFDILGNSVLESNDNILAGEYSKDIDISGLPPGVYFATIRTNGLLQTKHFVIVR
ncbi:MAG: T9SS type A sorting domain-containing protein [bacterium]